MINIQKTQKIDEIVQTLKVLKDDEALPRNIKVKIDSIISVMEEDSDISGKIGKSLHIIDEISEDLNIPAFLKPKVWEISTMLEGLNN